MKEKLQNIVHERLFVSIAGIILGFLLVVMQSQALDYLVWLCGLVLVGIAIVYAFRYVVGKNSRGVGLIATAVVSALIGLFCVMRPQAIVDFLPMLIGIGLAIDGIANIIVASSLPKSESGAPNASLILAIVQLILGVLIVLHPGVLADFIIILMGATLLFGGIVDLVVMLQERAK